MLKRPSQENLEIIVVARWDENKPEKGFKLRGSNHPISYDSMNCIRFYGYVLSPGCPPKHPNRNVERIGP
jgi:hypothetical protein